MYRIDENTYIDDSLIICAEYQLFTDEMRTQGKYHQPDHWTSYQFPAGQALQPVLGMRHSDAKAFCIWLSQREAGDWHYRLPNANEAAQAPLKPYGQSPLGYWINGEDMLEGATIQRFAWHGSPTANPYNLDLDHVFDRIINHTINLDHAINHARAITRAINLNRAIAIAIALRLNKASVIDRTVVRILALIIDRDLDRARAIARAIAIARVYAIDRDLAIGRARAIALDLALGRNLALAIDRDHAIVLARALALDLARTRDLAHDIAIDLARILVRDHDRAIVLARNLDHAIDRARDSAIACAIALARDLDLDLARARDLARDIAIARAHDLNLDYNLDQSDSTIRIYDHLQTLQERIAGRSPAFEGIRIVKERNKFKENA